MFLNLDFLVKPEKLKTLDMLQTFYPGMYFNKDVINAATTKGPFLLFARGPKNAKSATDRK